MDTLQELRDLRQAVIMSAGTIPTSERARKTARRLELVFIVNDLNPHSPHYSDPITEDQVDWNHSKIILKAGYDAAIVGSNIVTGYPELVNRAELTDSFAFTFEYPIERPDGTVTAYRYVHVIKY
jgi:hypothetical protein